MADCRRSHPEWVVVLAGIGAALHVGKLSPALPLLQQQFGFSLLEAGFLLSLVQLAGMVLGLLLGLAADTLGLRRCVLAGLLLLTVASMAGGVSQSVGALLAWRAVEGIGFLLVCMPAPALVRRMVPVDRVRPALGWWGAYMPAGTALALLVGPWILQSASWRLWWWLLAAVSLVLCVLVAFAVPPDPHGVRQKPSTNAAGAGGLPVLWIHRLRLTLSSRGPWQVAVLFALYSGQWLAVVGFLPSILASQGITGAALGVPLALVAGVNIAGNVVAGKLLGSGAQPRWLLCAGFTAMALGATVAFYGVQVTPMSLGEAGWRFGGALLFSMFGGLVPATLFSLAVAVAPHESCVSTTVGWMQQLSAFGQFAGPPLVGWIGAATGSWRWTWCVTGAAAMLGLVLALRLGREVKA